MAQCKLCHTESHRISKALAVCLDCIRKYPEASVAIVQEAHRVSRKAFDLPKVPPRDPRGKPCNLCVNRCRIPVNGVGYCGVRKNVDGRLTGAAAGAGNLSWYHDPLPTNCVGDWVCAGGTGAGYPEYAYCPGPERGYTNLAVFFHACSFNCLYCQNWHFRKQSTKPSLTPTDRLVSDVDKTTACICYFGGDPVPQLPFSLRASKQAIDANKDRILRICWETNGSMHPRLLDRMVDMALATGGCIKFDLKAWDASLHMALTGVDNRQTIANFKRAGKRLKERTDPPLLIASTLLVPGYIDETEIRHLARFIVSVDPGIPYTLLAFHPQFYMPDMPLTTKEEGYGLLSAAKAEGLEQVKIGNIHLLR